MTLDQKVVALSMYISTLTTDVSLVDNVLKQQTKYPPKMENKILLVFLFIIKLWARTNIFNLSQVYLRLIRIY